MREFTRNQLLARGLIALALALLLLGYTVNANSYHKEWKANTCMERVSYAFEHSKADCAWLGIMPDKRWHVQAKDGERWLVVIGSWVEPGAQEDFNPIMKMSREQYAEYYFKVRGEYPDYWREP